jgi:hypothetical protein
MDEKREYLEGTACFCTYKGTLKRKVAKNIEINSEAAIRGDFALKKLLLKTTPATFLAARRFSYRTSLLDGLTLANVEIASLAKAGASI